MTATNPDTAPDASALRASSGVVSSRSLTPRYEIARNPLKAMASASARMNAGTLRSAASSVLIRQPDIERLKRALGAHLVQDRAAVADRPAHRIRVRAGDDHGLGSFATGVEAGLCQCRVQLLRLGRAEPDAPGEQLVERALGHPLATVDHHDAIARGGDILQHVARQEHRAA